MRRYVSFCFLGLVLAPSLARAHHGQDFLLLESPSVPHPGDAYLIANAQAALDGDAEEQAGFEPALLVGTTPRLAFELHAHTEKAAGNDWAYEATAPAVHVLLTDPERHAGLKVGLSAEYEIAAEAHAPDHLEMRLSAETGSERVKWAGNLIVGREQGGDSDVGAALGFRRQLRPGFALGAEGQGSFQRAAGAQVLAGAYFEHAQSWALKLGLGGEREEDGHVTPVVHVGLVLRLRD
jgi:hypothetical protein